MKVLVGTTIGVKTEFLDRWIDCYSKFTYKDKECVISSDIKETIDYINNRNSIIADNRNRINTIYFDSLDGIWNGKPHALILMGIGKEKIKNYVCRHQDIDWLLLTDSDIECPPDTIERFLSITGNIPSWDKPNVIWTENLGAVIWMQRNVAESIHFWSTICLHYPFHHVEENYEILRQLNHYNNCVSGFPKPFRILNYNANWLRHRNEPYGKY